MLALSDRVTNINEIISHLRAAIADEALVDLALSPSQAQTRTFFVCKNGNLRKKEVIYVTLPEESGWHELFRTSNNVFLRFQSNGKLIEFSTRFLEMTDKDGDPCAKLQFPSVIMVKSLREFQRVQVPPHIPLEISIRKKNMRPFRVKVLDIGQGGLSFSYPLVKSGDEGPPPYALKIDDFINVEIHVQERYTSYEIPISGALRRVSTVRDAQHRAQVICGVQFMLVSVTYQGKFNTLVQFMEAEWEQMRKDRQGGASTLLEECDKEREQTIDTHPEIHEAIRQGRVEVMLQLLEEWQSEPKHALALVDGLIRHAYSHDMLNAYRLLQGIRNHNGGQRLFDAILDKRHFETLMKLFQYLPEGTPDLQRLEDVVLETFSGDRLMEAIRRTRDKPGSQMKLIDSLSRKGTMSNFLDSLAYLSGDSEGTALIANQIADRSNTAEDLLRVLATIKAMIRDDASQALIIVVRKLVRLAPSPMLLHILEKYVSDQGEAGEMVVSELVQRGNPNDMVNAFRFVTMDSLASVILAWGMTRKGNLDHLRQGIELSRTCPRARIILIYVLLASQKGTLAGFFSPDPDLRKADILKGKQLMEEARVAFTQLRQRMAQETSQE